MMPAAATYYRGTLVVAAFLGLQTLVASLVSEGRPAKLAVPLENFPRSLGENGRWKMVRESQISPSEAAVLRADHVLIRSYQADDVKDVVAPLSLMVAYFEAQAQGRQPHSPKNCLPGSGYEPVESSIVQVGEIPVNRYLLAKDDLRILMLYWYQSGRRAVASEYAAKLFLVNDALLYRRTESTIVRVTVPLQHAADRRSEDEALAFVRAVQPAVLAHLPK